MWKKRRPPQREWRPFGVRFTLSLPKGGSATAFEE